MNILTINEAFALKHEIETGTGRYENHAPDETEMAIEPYAGIGYLVSKKDANCLYAKVDCNKVRQLMNGAAQPQ